MLRIIRGLSSVAALALAAACGPRDPGTSCFFYGTQLAQSVGINGSINASLPCPTLLYGGPRSVGFQGSIVADAGSVLPSQSYSLRNRLGDIVFTANPPSFVNGSQRVWQVNYLISIGTGGLSTTSSQNVDSLIAVGTAAGGGQYKFWTAIQYRSTQGMQIQWNGTPWEGSDFMVYATVQDPDITSPVKFDWALDGSSTSFDTGSNQLIIPGATAGTWRDVRVTATGANGRQAIANHTVTFQTCTAECNQFRIMKSGAVTGGHD